MTLSRFPRGRVWLLAAGLFFVSACDTPAPTDPSPDVPPPSAALIDGGPERVLGAGQFVVGDGLLRNWGFTAIRLGNGTVLGRFRGYNPASGGRIAGKVTCFSIVGDRAWVGGTVERANFGVEGTDTGWIVRDADASGSAGPDQLSFAVPVSSAEEFCATQPGPPPGGLLLQDLVSGAMVIVER